MKFQILLVSVLVIWYHELTVAAQQVKGSLVNSQNKMTVKYSTFDGKTKNKEKIKKCYRLVKKVNRPKNILPHQEPKYDAPDPPKYETHEPKYDAPDPPKYELHEPKHDTPDPPKYETHEPKYDAPDPPKYETHEPKYDAPDPPKYETREPKYDTPDPPKQEPHEPKYDNPTDNGSNYNDLEFDPNEMLSQVNTKRKEQGSPPLKLSDKLMKIAQKHSEWMSQNNNMDHTGEGSTQPCNRCKNAGYMPNFCTENVAFKQKSVKDAMESWIKSPGHLQNLMDPEAKEAGFGMVNTYWTQLFGQGEGDRGDGVTVVCPEPGGRYAENFPDSDYGVSPIQFSSPKYGMGGLNNLNFGSNSYGSFGY